MQSPRLESLGRAGLLAAIFALLWSAGCSGDPKLPTAEERIAFDQAVPQPPKLEAKSATPATLPSGPYRVVEGDLLEIQMPQVLRAIYSDAPSVFDIKPYRCRVGEDGTICLPSAGQIKTAGLTLTQFEGAVVEAYHPRLVRERPTIVAQVVEYRTAKVTIVGAVDKPGVYDLRSDEMSLAAAIMKAGGIVKEGSSLVRVCHGNDKETSCLPVAGTNVPALNVALSGGETITVERLPASVFMVVGLVKKPGVFPYPPDTKYTLLQAIGFAGGLDELSEPEYVRVCRSSDGKCMSMAVKVSNQDVHMANSVYVHPGDTVFVEQTPSTKARRTFWLIISRIGMNVGGSAF